MWRGFDRAAWASRVRCPVLVLHGTEDGVSPVEDGRAIAAASRGTMIEINGAGHNDLWTDDRWAGTSVAEVLAFLRSVRSHALDGGDSEHVEAVLEDAADEGA